jgi:hypothetical protein
MEMNIKTQIEVQKLAEAMLKEFGGRPYNMSVQVYSENTYVTVQKKCFAFMFTNIGDTTATVKGMVIFPSATPTTALGDSRSISGHKLDIYTGTMDLSFRAPVGAAPQVEIVQLYYVD